MVRSSHLAVDSIIQGHPLVTLRQRLIRRKRHFHDTAAFYGLGTAYFGHLIKHTQKRNPSVLISIHWSIIKLQIKSSKLKIWIGPIPGFYYFTNL